MYFNFRSLDIYTIKFAFALVSFFLLIFISLIIITKALKELQKNYNSQKTLEKIFKENTNSLDKFKKIKKELKLNSSYQLAKFVKLNESEIKKLIENKNYEILLKLIENNAKS